MFTVFMPYSDHLRSVACFDDDLLYTQLFDTINLVTALCDGDSRSKLLAYHQWTGYEGTLLLYLRRMQVEVQKRDLMVWQDDERRSPYAVSYIRLSKAGKNLAPRPPRWHGARWLLESHRSNLIRIAPETYAHQFPTARLDMPLLYPQNRKDRFDYVIATSRSDQLKLESGQRVIPHEYLEYFATKGFL